MGPRRDERTAIFHGNLKRPTASAEELLAPVRLTDPGDPHEPRLAAAAPTASPQLGAEGGLPALPQNAPATTPTLLGAPLDLEPSQGLEPPHLAPASEAPAQPHAEARLDQSRATGEASSATAAPGAPSRGAPLNPPGASSGQALAAQELAAQRGLQLRPMPQAPAGLFGALPYLLALWRGQWERKTLITRLNGEIACISAQLEEIFRDLGRIAHRQQPRPQSLGRELAALDQLHQAHASGGQRREELAAGLEQTLAAFEAAHRGEREHLKELAERAAVATDEQAAVRRSQQAQRSELSELDRQIKAREKTLADKQSRAPQTSDPALREVLIRGIAELDIALADLGSQRELLVGQLDALDAPLATLKSELEGNRNEQAALRQILGSAERELELQNLATREEIRRCAAEQSQLDREISRALAAAGQALDRSRIAAAPYEESYGGIDRYRGELGEVMRLIRLLEQERESFDPAARKKGLALLLGLSSLALALVLGLAWALA